MVCIAGYIIYVSISRVYTYQQLFFLAMKHKCTVCCLSITVIYVLLQLAIRAGFNLKLGVPVQMFLYFLHNYAFCTCKHAELETSALYVLGYIVPHHQQQRSYPYLATYSTVM